MSQMRVISFQEKQRQGCCTINQINSFKVQRNDSSVDTTNQTPILKTIFLHSDEILPLRKSDRRLLIMHLNHVTASITKRVAVRYTLLQENYSA